MLVILNMIENHGNENVASLKDINYFPLQTPHFPVLKIWSNFSTVSNVLDKSSENYFWHFDKIMFIIQYLLHCSLTWDAISYNFKFECLVFNFQFSVSFICWYYHYDISTRKRLILPLWHINENEVVRIACNQMWRDTAITWCERGGWSLERARKGVLTGFIAGMTRNSVVQTFPPSEPFITFLYCYVPPSPSTKAKQIVLIRIMQIIY